MVVETPAGPVTYLNVHTRIPHIRTTGRHFGLPRLALEFHAERRRREIRKLVQMLGKIAGPVIVGGDFNMTEHSPDHRLISSHLNDAYRAVGAGLGHSFPRRGSFPPTFPAPWPMLRLDYVWHSEHFEPVWAYRGDAGHSDHHPIVVGLRWSQARRGLQPAVPLAASTV
jgi:endonuclease/exonuclease/phosphatase family metal-dependent hydrolase